MKRVLWLSLLLIIGVPSAHAHLMNTGLGPFYDGLAHLFVTPEDLLPVIALALLAGLCGPQSGRAVLFILPMAWLAGALVGASSDMPLTLPVTTAIVTIAFGVLVAADRLLPLRLVVGCAVVLGLVHGSLNGTDLGQQRALSQHCWSCRCVVCARIASGRTGGVSATGLGTHCGASGRELDCCQRLVYAGLGGARTHRLEQTR